jgi:hypothetical protein
MDSIKVANSPSSRVEIIPLHANQGEAVPRELLPYVDRLPKGSFLIQNLTETRITAVVAQWAFIYSAGVKKRQIQCDGYLFAPTQTIVGPRDMALITPGACTSREMFSRLNGPAIGSPLASSINATVLRSEPNLESVEITIDSIIFQDGSIWGPDRQQYYDKIMQRHVAAESFVREVTDAVARGEDVRTRARKIHEENASRNDRASALKGHYATLLEHSPNPEGTLKQLQAREPLPEFHHVQEEEK